MISILNQILTFITTLINFLINTISSFLNLISNIPNYFNFLVGATAYMPSIVLPFIMASVSIYIVLFMLGRNV